MTTRSSTLPTLVLLVLFAVISGSSLLAEILPTWGPSELTRQSDLVVVAQLLPESRLRITEILKGRSSERVLSVPGLRGFRNGDLVTSSPVTMDLGTEAVLFLSQRDDPPRVVANGLYRAGSVDSRSGMLGYWQPLNPGGYVLNPVIRFEGIAAIKEAVRAELQAIPLRQKRLIEAARTAGSDGEFREALAQLGRVTRLGDLAVLEQVAALDVGTGGRRLHDVAGLIRDVGDPGGATLLEELYRKHRETHVLDAMARLGQIDSLVFFEEVIEKEMVSKPLFGLYPMKELYLAVERKGDRQGCERIREVIYRYVDQDLMDLMMSDPRLVAVIPHEGSLERLRRAHRHHAARQSNAEYEIERCIKRCEEKMAARGGMATAR